MHFEEDFIRVYPDGLCFSDNGQQRTASDLDINNFLNHARFYLFVSQFVTDRKVADIGCGAGYGAKMLKYAGALEAHGADASDHAIDFAKKNYGQDVQFSQQDIVALNTLDDGYFDITVCSEVLEHIKEYGKAHLALKELKRITRKGGLVIVGTPNAEMLGDHGFWFDEIEALFAEQFAEFLIFENALEPIGLNCELWEKRRAKGRVGMVISQDIEMNDVVFFPGERERARLKSGAPVGILRWQGLDIDTSLLHNTHSWIVIARK